MQTIPDHWPKSDAYTREQRKLEEKEMTSNQGLKGMLKKIPAKEPQVEGSIMGKDKQMTSNWHSFSSGVGN